MDEARENIIKESPDHFQTSLALSRLMENSGQDLERLFESYKNKVPYHGLRDIFVPIAVSPEGRELVVHHGAITPSFRKPALQKMAIYDHFSVGIMAKDSRLITEYFYRTTWSQKLPLEDSLDYFENEEELPQALLDFTAKNKGLIWAHVGRDSGPTYLTEALTKYKIPPVEDIKFNDVEKFCKENFDNPRYFPRLPEL